MKIEKYKKMSRGRYKVFFDNNLSIIFYEDIILKHNLLLKKEITEDELDKIVIDNNEYSSYDMALEYISRKLRCEKEIREYLKKKNIDEKSIEDTIKKLKNNKLLDEITYIKAYSYDKFNLNNYGPNKIKKELNNLGFDLNLINDNVLIDQDDINDKLEKLIDKKIKSMKNYSGNILKNKIIYYFCEQGYSKENIVDILDKKELNSEDSYNKEYEKLYRKYSKKYSGDELERFIKNKLYQKGFKK